MMIMRLEDEKRLALQVLRLTRKFVLSVRADVHTSSAHRASAIAEPSSGASVSAIKRLERIY